MLGQHYDKNGKQLPRWKMETDHPHIFTEGFNLAMIAEGAA
ncbi:hypothetical protein [Serratia plymuthica]|nr:hypothetical protein [Serratia plymuthica]